MLLTACTVKEQYSPGRDDSSPVSGQPAAVQAAQEPDFAVQSWLQAWQLLKAKWGISGEAYLQSFNFRTEGERLTGLNLAVLAKKGEQWQIYRYDYDKNYGLRIRQIPDPFMPDKLTVVDGDRFFTEINPLPVKDFAYPNADMGNTALIIKAEDGTVLPATDDNEFYIWQDGKMTTPPQGNRVIVDTRQVLLQSNAVGGSKNKPEKGRQYLIVSLSGPVETTAVTTDQPKNNSYPYGLRIADLDGDSVREELILWGIKSNPEAQIPDKFQLTVRKGQTETVADIVLDNAFYGTRLILRDLTADGRPEVIIEEYAGGSGNVTFLHVYKFNNGVPERFFQSEDYMVLAGVENSYLGNNRVKISIKPLKLTWEYDLVISNYNPQDQAQDEQVKAEFSKNWVDPFSAYELTDLDNDGKVEIIGYQVICGTAHVDVVGSFRQIFKFDGKKFSRKGLELYRFIDYGEERINPLS